MIVFENTQHDVVIGENNKQINMEIERFRKPKLNFLITWALY